MLSLLLLLVLLLLLLLLLPRKINIVYRIINEYTLLLFSFDENRGPVFQFDARKTHTHTHFHTRINMIDARCIIIVYLSRSCAAFLVNRTRRACVCVYTEFSNVRTASPPPRVPPNPLSRQRYDVRFALFGNRSVFLRFPPTMGHVR